MSIDRITQVWGLKMPAAHLLVLVTLADRADNKDGLCWPSHRDIGQRCNLSERRVREIVGDLRAAGAITVRRRQRRPAEYLVHPERALPIKPHHRQAPTEFRPEARRRSKTPLLTGGPPPLDRLPAATSDRLPAAVLTGGPQPLPLQHEPSRNRQGREPSRNRHVSTDQDQDRPELRPAARSHSKTGSIPATDEGLAATQYGNDHQKGREQSSSLAILVAGLEVLDADITQDQLSERWASIPNTPEAAACVRYACKKVAVNRGGLPEVECILGPLQEADWPANPAQHLSPDPKRTRRVKQGAAA